MVENKEIILTFAREGPIIMKMCEDVPTLQRLLIARNQYVERLESRLKRERRIKNVWKQRAIDLGYKS